MCLSKNAYLFGKFLVKDAEKAGNKNQKNVKLIRDYTRDGQRQTSSFCVSHL